MRDPLDYATPPKQQPSQRNYAGCLFPIGFALVGVASYFWLLEGPVGPSEIARARLRLFAILAVALVTIILGVFAMKRKH